MYTCNVLFCTVLYCTEPDTNLCYLRLDIDSTDANTNAGLGEVLAEQNIHALENQVSCHTSCHSCYSCHSGSSIVTRESV